MQKERKRYARTLTIASSDSGGGAGIQADLKTFSALGCYGMSVIVALTAQNTSEVRGIHAVPAEFAAEQVDAVVEDIGVDAVKIGMLFNSAIMKAIADRLKKHKIHPVVLDPVMVAKSGDRLMEQGAIRTLREQLFPLSTLITPNIPEAEALLEHEIETRNDMETAARNLLEFGSNAVLLKGGHFSERESVDCLVSKEPIDGKSVHWYESDRVDTKNTHGTGCTLSSAIASGLAKGQSLPRAVGLAKEYITGAISAGSRYTIGRGHGPLHHFYQFWQ